MTTKQELMARLYIKEDSTAEQIMEKLYLLAILQEGTEITARITKKYLELRDIMRGVQP